MSKCDHRGMLYQCESCSNNTKNIYHCGDCNFNRCHTCQSFVCSKGYNKEKKMCGRCERRQTMTLSKDLYSSIYTRSSFPLYRPKFSYLLESDSD